MGLVDYSDSETSDVEQIPSIKTAPPSKGKPAFAKVVDRSNPGKIKVSLPQASLKADANSDEPPTKRAKTGGGSFGGFNSFLPAPKRAGPATKSTLGGAQGKKLEVGAKFSFKTGAAPAFDRGGGGSETEYREAEEGSQEHATSTDLPGAETTQAEEEVKLVGKPLMFKPLSVSRKPAKKKAGAAKASTLQQAPITPQPIEKPAPRPKVSLFSLPTESDHLSFSTTSSSADYKPILDSPEEETNTQESFDDQPSYEDSQTTPHPPPFAPTPPISQSLTDIAGDLNLSAAERRQLFGRQKGGRATNVINFNTDQEYLHNEELRAGGEQAVHNPVRAIAPGKHSLKQLLNAAQSQKEALEESFAKGKTNRAEASSRYGW